MRRVKISRERPVERFVTISANPNTPMAMITKPMPSPSSGTPKVKRSAPELMSVPTSPRISPSTVIATALRSEPCERTTAPASPSTMSEKYSAGPKVIASSPSQGPAAARTRVDTVPAKNEAIAAMARAAPARPCRAIWCPSRQVTTDDASPGRFTRIDVVEPPYWAP
jgi:hypothetical protein